MSIPPPRRDSIVNQCTAPEQAQAGAVPATAAPTSVDKGEGPAATVSVLLPLPLAEAYDYLVPADTVLEPGQFVAVPLGRSETIGVVWGTGTGTVPQEKLREVIAVLDAPPMRATMRAFVEWVAGYTLAPPGLVLRMAVRAPGALEPPRMETVYRLADDAAARAAEIKLTPARQRVLDVLGAAPSLPMIDLAREAGVGTGVVKGLVTSGAVLAEQRAAKPHARVPDPETHGPTLTAAQQAAATRLVEQVDARTFSVTLLDGVPGAGKTEVYFEAVAQALRQGRQALVLLPEIALSAQWLERFTRRFGAPPTEWHSDLSSAERRQAWRRVGAGEAKVVVGARSALFLPFQDLALIVVDEEHDPSFKQEDGAIYNARDMAIVRARLEGSPVVLCSATPSLETWHNAGTGRYELLHLPERHGSAGMPPIVRVDLRRDSPSRGRFLAPGVRQAIGETLAAGEQALLFLNRRGYAPLTLCRTCGFRIECPNCRAWLVEHRYRQRLVCHHCGHERSLPPHCPACEAKDAFVACGPGVERVAEEVQGDFPEARVEIFSSDATATRGAAQALIERIGQGEVDIVIGTQMAAKGHHFPNLTLVAVVDADLGLAGGDLRAAERTFQLLYQVAGRAGREARPGRALLQTWMPEHPVIAALASGERERFLAAELEERERAGMPPFARLAALVVSGPDEAEVEAVARALGRAAPTLEGVRVLGPVPPPLAVLRGRFRRRLLMIAERGVSVPGVLRPWLAAVRVPGRTRVQIDVDPYTFL
jgi:primosomal protein N' (replication factor Y)